MNKNQAIDYIEKILEDNKTAILATIGEEELPQIRWMVASIIRHRKGSIFCISDPRSNKCLQIQNNPKVQWLIQSRALDKIVNINGTANIIDNPALRSEVVESIGNRMNTFWTLHKDLNDFIVIETSIESVNIYLPMKGQKELVNF